MLEEITQCYYHTLYSEVQIFRLNSLRPDRVSDVFNYTADGPSENISTEVQLVITIFLHTYYSSGEHEFSSGSQLCARG